ncbi:MAG: thiamine biosynthesis protein ThiS [Bacteroidetes bacterium RBG_13_43_22]|nr:MAG: thiamine biosynthesis protein ThiS [Bacteroidetes bacterium RBG_13_43_22]
MKILLNNREEEFAEETMSVTRMIELKKFSFRMRVIKINGTLIPREKYDTAIIRDRDNVQMLYLMSGG